MESPNTRDAKRKREKTDKSENYPITYGILLDQEACNVARTELWLFPDWTPLALKLSLFLFHFFLNLLSQTVAIHQGPC